MKKIKEIRSKVMKIANRIRKNRLNLSQALKRAWQIVKASLIIKVAGISKGNRQTACEHLLKYSNEDIEVKLEREYNNIYDKNAIAVMVSVKGSRAYKLGYIPAVTAVILAMLIDKGMEVNALFKEIRGKYFKYMNWGAVIEIII